MKIDTTIWVPVGNGMPWVTLSAGTKDAAIARYVEQFRHEPTDVVKCRVVGG